MALDDFIVHSHYPTDKIVWAYEAVVNSSNPYWDANDNLGLFIPVPLGLDPTKLLIDGVWTTNGWATSYPINCNGRVSGWYYDGFSYSPEYDRVDANIYLPIQGSWITITQPTLWVAPDVTSGGTPEIRLWIYLEESDMDSYTSNKTAEQLQHSLQKTTALAQLNMISENVITVPDGATSVINHNLGFRPFCKIWRNIGGTWEKNNTGTVYDMDNPYNLNKITIDDRKITIYAKDGYGDGESTTYLIRIYNYAIPQ